MIIKLGIARVLVYHSNFVALEFYNGYRVILYKGNLLQFRLATYRKKLISGWVLVTGKYI